MSESNKTTYEWQNIPWRKLERSVYKLQKRIYQASSRGDKLTAELLKPQFPVMEAYIPRLQRLKRGVTVIRWLNRRHLNFPHGER